MTWPACGEYDLDGDTIQPYPCSYAAWLTDHVQRSLRHGCQLAPEVTECDRPWAESLLAGAEAAFGVFEPCFVMNDYRLGFAAYQAGEELHYSYPIVILVGHKGG